MSVGKMAKSVGLSSVAEVARLAGTSTANLYNWADRRPDLLECVILGAALKKQTQRPGDTMPELINAAIRGEIKLNEE